MTTKEKFVSVLDLVSKSHGLLDFNTSMAGAVATAIERHGIYTYDLYIRLVKAEEGGGWYCSYDEETERYTVKHDQPHKASRCTVSAALCMLAVRTHSELEDFLLEPQFVRDPPNVNGVGLVNYGWPTSKLPDFAEIKAETAGNPAPPKGKKAQQIDAIMNAVKGLEYPPHCIPRGGKGEVEKKCMKNLDLFSEASFKKAWQAARNEGLIDVENVEIYKK